MKFARYLEENVVVEWRRAYINYRGLKKLIKRVDARYKARTSLELSKQSSTQSGSTVQAWTTATVEGLRRRQRRFSSASGGETASDTPIWPSGARNAAKSYGGAGNAAVSGGDNDNDDTEQGRSDRLPQVTLDGTGLSIVTHRPSTDTAQTDVHNDEEHNGTVPRQDAGHTSTPPQPRLNNEVDVEAAGGRTMQQAHSQNSLLARLRRAGQGEGDDKHANGNADGRKKKKSKKARKKMSHNETELSEMLHSTFDQQERLFFDAVDEELARIVKFYVTRETDMAKRYEMLARQLEELAEHRREYKATHPPTTEGWTDLSKRFSHLVAPVTQQAQTLKRASLQIARPSNPLPPPPPQQQQPKQQAANDSDKKVSVDGYTNERFSVDEGDRRRAAALSKMLNVYGGTISETEDAELRKANQLAAQSHDPERYKVARKKLKVAVLEYYRGLEILKNYKILNRTGFAKILKKFEKTTEVHVADAYYHARVAPSVLVASDTVEKLLKGTEEIFTAYFEHGNRKRALERLRIHTGSVAEQQSSTHHFSSARSGFYLGIALCATVGGIVSALHEETPRQIPMWDQLMRVYGAEFLPTMFALLFGLNLAAWHYARVNAVFIFEWDVRHVMDFHQYFELPALFLLLLSLAFWVSFLNPFPDAIAPTTWPLVWLVVVLVIMLNPLPILHYRARRWFIMSLLRVFHGGLLSTVEFRDFFLGDELNSINWSISMLWFFGCEYNHDWAVPNQCDPNGTYWTAVLLALPAFLRWLQCFRRWRDSHYTANLHLINAGKYSTTILYSFFYIHYRYHGSSRTTDLALWCLFGCIYSVYTAAWDIMMDWSLLQPRARFSFLRNELVYEQYWPFYYWAIVSNIILRFGWTIYLLPGPASNLMRIFVVALVEMLRRFQWNFLRLENEHLGNVDMYRVSREVPLPYHVRPRNTNIDDDDDDLDPKANGGMARRLPAFGSKALMRLVRQTDVKKDMNDDDDDGDAWVPPLSAAGLTKTDANGTSQDDSGRKGKAPAADADDDDDDDEDDEDQEGARGSPNQKGRRGSSSLVARIRDSLVPDHGGMHATGSGLAQIGVAHGAGARDYEPRRTEPASGLDSDDSGSEAGPDAISQLPSTNDVTKKESS